MNRKTLNRNRRRVISLLTLAALLLQYVPIIGIGEITAAAHSAETAVVDATTATGIAHAENAVVDASFTQVRTWNTIVSTSSSQGPAQRPLRGDVEDCLNGTVSYWKLNEAGTPTTFEDFYDDNNGACSGVNCPISTTGIISGAMDFDGTSDYLTVEDDDSLDWGSDDSFSIEVWANCTNVSSSNKVMIGAGYGGIQTVRSRTSCPTCG